MQYLSWISPFHHSIQGMLRIFEDDSGAIYELDVIYGLELEALLPALLINLGMWCACRAGQWWALVHLNNISH